MRWKQWKLGLVVAVVSGIATAFAVGVVVPTMTWRQELYVCLGCIGKDLLLFLKEHPYDQVSFDTVTITKQKTEINEKVTPTT